MTITAATPLADIHNYTAAMLEFTGHSCLLVSFLWVIEKTFVQGDVILVIIIIIVQDLH